MWFYLLAMIAIPLTLAYLSHLLDQGQEDHLEEADEGRPVSHEAA